MEGSQIPHPWFLGNGNVVDHMGRTALRSRSDLKICCPLVSGVKRCQPCGGGRLNVRSLFASIFMSLMTIVQFWAIEFYETLNVERFEVVRMFGGWYWV